MPNFINGNAGNNNIVDTAGDDVIDGMAGDDRITLTNGVDTAQGGDGDDTLVLSWGAGTADVETTGFFTDNATRTASYGGIERFEITTGTGNDDIISGAADDIVSVGDGNDEVHSSGGDDQVFGQGGDDLIDVGTGDDSADGGTGIDGIIADMSAAVSAISWNLNANTYTGPIGAFANLEYFSSVVTGSGNDQLVSGAGDFDELIDAGDGDDTITIFNGVDNVQGGAGNDTMVLAWGAATTAVVTTGFFTDNFTRTASYGGIERFVITTGSGNDDIVTSGADDIVSLGNGADHALGGGGDDALDGGAGNDTLDGGSGADELRGGDGNDTYVVDDAGDLALEASALGGTDTVQSSIAYTLGANLENLTLTGFASINGAGNALANVLTGNSGANTLNGQGGVDVMKGAAGNDVYIVDTVGDQAVETDSTGGVDRVQSAVSFTLGAFVENLTLTGVGAINGTGNTLANVITGNGAANILNGGGGVDIMKGGGGNDTYVVETVGELAVESSAAGGIDLVQSSASFTLGNFVENLTLTGAGAINGNGNALANVINGNGANNLLNGGAGADTLRGGLGDDVYVVDDAGDTVTESSAVGGADTVQSSVGFALGNNVENLTLTGGAAINGTGNALANTINGNGAANLLDGGVGADTLRGGNGNDTYVIDNAGDTVSESSAAGGTDTVQSSVSFTLGNNVENLTLTGAAAINGTGNALANTINGNGAANQLDGLDGSDTLHGGAGADGFRFTTALGATNVDSILDMQVGVDTIVLENAVFTGLAAGALATGAFHTGAAAADADDRIIYNNATGALLFDSDGVGAAAAVQFATLGVGLVMTASEFTVI